MIIDSVEPMANSLRPTTNGHEIRCEAVGTKSGTVTLFPSDVKSRHDKMVGLVETRMTADSLQPTAYARMGMSWSS